MSNPVSWFEVPALDMDRACKFYNEVFGWDIKPQQLGDEFMAWFPFDEKALGASGSLVKHSMYQPRDNGTVVYFSCEDVQQQIDRVESAGGKVLQGKKLIAPEHGYMALALDSEGNRIAFHSRK